MRARRANAFLRVAALLAILGLIFMVWSVLQPTPMPVILAMSVGQGFGTLSFLIYLGVVILSTTQDLAGTSLAPLGMPGCSSWLGSLDVSTAFIGVTPVQSRSFQVPAGVPPGTQVFAMAVALVQAGTLNAFGAVTSNGVASFVNAF